VDERFEGQKLADTLNAVASGADCLSFGRNPVLVNYAEPVPCDSTAIVDLARWCMIARASADRTRERTFMAEGGCAR
jgi:hypothetical protein